MTFLYKAFTFFFCKCRTVCIWFGEWAPFQNGGLFLPMVTVATQCFNLIFLCFVLVFFFAGNITMWCNFLMNVLAIYMVEEFYIYAVVQFFFLQEKVYCMNPDTKVTGRNQILIRYNAVPHVKRCFVNVKCLKVNVEHLSGVTSALVILFNTDKA